MARKLSAPVESSLKEFVERQLSASEIDAHTLDHTVRVYRLAMQIGREVGADLRVLGAAAILHDVGRAREAREGISHAILSGEMSIDILKSLGFSESEIRGIVDAIRTHRFSEGLEPNSLEGRILSDADKIDAMGAIGVFRAVAQATRDGRGIQGFIRHAEEKLLRLRDLIYTDEARQIANEKHETLERFVEELRSEVDS
ncbi:MAG: HD domain-containing protein [Candidatus Thorarchaeota archaeon]|nr:MAG: hypothetical protein DRP09_08315 [Candidatus Thorarchaeota archaeon]RLI59904.1 MAG: hypothetical protein DRO87_01410 [Candidatus Thorarchaeota archaeon]